MGRPPLCCCCGVSSNWLNAIRILHIFNVACYRKGAFVLPKLLHLNIQQFYMCYRSIALRHKDTHVISIQYRCVALSLLWLCDLLAVPSQRVNVSLIVWAKEVPSSINYMTSPYSAHYAEVLILVWWDGWLLPIYNAFFLFYSDAAAALQHLLFSLGMTLVAVSCIPYYDNALYKS